MRKIDTHSLMQDLGLIILSVLVAVILVKTDVLTAFLTATKQREVFGSFVAGMFFTSAFTTAPAIATLGEIANANSVVITALFGALGAVVGDLIIFRFVRNRLSVHLMELVAYEGATKRIKALLKMKYFRWFTFLLGGLIIASPLPDELGIGLMGFSQVKLSWFIPLSLSFNFIGILIIGLIARAL